jgi:flagellar hook-length control protein FliK
VSFESALARESAAAGEPTAPLNADLGDAHAPPSHPATADGTGEPANSAPAKRTAPRGATATDPATAPSATTELSADVSAVPVAGPLITLPDARALAADAGLGTGSGAGVQLTEAADVDSGDLLSADEPLVDATGTPNTETLASATDTPATAALPLEAVLPLTPAAHADALAPAHAAAHVREPAGVRHASAEAAPLAPPPPTLADAQRAADVLRQVRLQLVPELKSAVIQLAPAELGRVSIELEIDKDQVVARVRAEQPEALGALQRHLPELRAALARQGLETQHVEFALGFQDGQRGRETQQGSRRSARAANEIDATDNAVHASVPLARALAVGGVDTYA